MNSVRVKRCPAVSRLAKKKRLVSLWNSLFKKINIIIFIINCRISITALHPNIQSNYFYCVHRRPIGYDHVNFDGPQSVDSIIPLLELTSVTFSRRWQY